MKNYLSTKAAAARLGVTPRQLTRLIASGKLKGQKVNPDALTSAYIIPEEALEAYIAHRRHKKNATR